MTRWQRFHAQFLGVLAGLLFTHVAHSTPNFPSAVQQVLGATAAPQCRICHLCGITGRGTVNTPWGVAMRSRGLQAFDETSLANALAAMELDGVDSDSDGIIDVDAVRVGSDPNPSGLCDAEDETIPRYGCVGQISPVGPPANNLVLGAGALVALLARRSRRRFRDGWLLALALTLAACLGAGCASGTALAPRPPGGHASHAPQMRPVVASQMADELRAMQLDPANLPVFDQLSSWKKRRLMSTFTRALGMGCTGCHDASDYRAPTKEQAITVQMWNEFTRPYAVQGGTLFCDSCHQGSDRYLDRHDSKATRRYMTESFTGKLQRHDSKNVQCETCHGDPFELEILARK